MAQLADELTERHELTEIAIHHRVGRVEIGEPSVVIAVSRRTAARRSPPARRRSTRSSRQCRSGRRRSTRAARSGSARAREVETRPRAARSRGSHEVETLRQEEGRGVRDTRAARGRRASRSAAGRSTRALLVTLVARPRSSRCRTSGSWTPSGPSDPPASAAHALQVYVSALRKDGLEIVRDGERLPAPGREQRRRRVRAAARRRARASRSPAVTRQPSSPSTQRSRLWRGPPLAGTPSDSAAGKARRFEELRVTALEDRADSALALGLKPDLHGARGPRRRASPPGAAARPPDARALPGRSPGGCPRGLRRRSAGRSTSWGSSREPSCAASRARSCARTQRSTSSPRPCGPAATCRPGHGARSAAGRRSTGSTTLLRGGARLVTLTGPGGVGKTRVAPRRRPRARRNVRRRRLVRRARGPRRSRPRAARRSRPRSSSRRRRCSTSCATRELLLLLDNFEQVLEAAPFVAELLQAAPRVRVLTTSRAPAARLRRARAGPMPPLARGGGRGAASSPVRGRRTRGGSPASPRRSASASTACRLRSSSSPLEPES